MRLVSKKTKEERWEAGEEMEEAKVEQNHVVNMFEWKSNLFETRKVITIQYKIWDRRRSLATGLV